MLQEWRGFVLLAVHFAVLGMTLYALVHAAMQRADAYTATDKLTKNVWLMILGAALVLGLLLMSSVFGTALAACAAGVYLADVRPRLLDVQGKSR